MDLPELARQIEHYVRPTTFPVALRMIRPGEDLPEKVKRPQADFGYQIAICQGISMARRYGWSLAMGREDLNCPLTKIAFGFEEAPSFYTEGHLACDMYTGSLEAGRVSEESVPRFRPGEYTHLVAAPLARARFEPHVVLVYGNSAQVMTLLVAALFQRGGRLTSSFGGRIDCADIVIETMQTNRPQVILPCYGDRVFAQTEDAEMAFTFPASLDEEVIAGLQGAHGGGVRYPVPRFLRYQGDFPPTYRELDEMLSRTEDGNRQANRP